MSVAKSSQNYIWFEKDFLGTGATGNVYMGRHRKTGNKVAVKVFNSQSHMRPHHVQMREFDVLRKLDHDNIVRLFCCEEEASGRGQVILMELCQSSLSDVLLEPENAYGLKESHFMSVLTDIAQGMQHLRESGIVHRDIKPGNILRYEGEDGRVLYKLTDFGAARELEDEESFQSLYGTEEYLYPDVYERAVLRINRGQKFGAAVDLWSVGVTLYHAATGQLPFRPFGGRRNKEMMHKITTEKASGVISGVQHSEGGRVEWSRELPQNCCLSIGLKQLVQPLLAGLIENDKKLMVDFDKFFMIVANIADRKVLHVLNTCNATLLHLYLEKSKGLMKLHDAIAEQTEVPAAHQCLMFKHRLLEELVEPSMSAESYPQTTSTEPMYLFYDATSDITALNNLPVPAVAGAPPANPSYPDSDYVYARSCTGLLCLLRTYTLNCKHIQDLLVAASTTFTAQMCHHVSQMNTFILQFKLAVQQVDKRVAQLCRSHAQLTQLLPASGVQPDFGENDPAILSQIQEESQELETKCQEIQKYVGDYHAKVVIDRETRTKQLKEFMLTTCQPSANCDSRMKLLVNSGEDTLNSFRGDRKLRRLQHNEEQIHVFEKQKLKNSCQKAHNYLSDHCFKNLREVFTKYTNWYRWAYKVNSRVGKIDAEAIGLSERLQVLILQLDALEKKLSGKVQEAVDRLPTAAAAAAGKQRAMPGRNAESALGDNPDDRHLMQQLMEGLRKLQVETTVVKQELQVVATNTERMIQDPDLANGMSPSNAAFPGSYAGS